MLPLRAYLIHHHDPARQEQRRALAELLAELQIPLEAISAQPPLTPLPSGWRGRWAVARRARARVQADFRQRRLREPQRWLAHWHRQLRAEARALLPLLGAEPAALAPLWRHQQVEAIVSAKHGQAWQQALAAGAATALVFEDDVEITAGSRVRLRQLLADLPALLSRWPRLYLDLAGGYPASQVLPLERALAEPGPADWLLAGVHTNTACGYLVSGPLLQAWQRGLQRRPALADLPIDHRINRLSAIAPPARSGHWQEPPFRHGSFCGSATSWQQS